jgi:predicted N-acetyltransferase YhbS
MSTSVIPSTVTAGSVVPAMVLRPLEPGDLRAVRELDRKNFGRSRQGYFERRLLAALRQPKRHLQLALTAPSGLVGFLLARQAGGEYGRPEEVAVLEAVGVAPQAQHAGLGRKLLEGLDEVLAARGVRTVTTQVDWRNHAMLRFLDGAGFSLAPRHVLERRVERIAADGDEDDDGRTPPVIRPLQDSDLNRVVRIDRRITGQDRGAYLKRKLDEALNESFVPRIVDSVDQLPGSTPTPSAQPDR